MNGPHFILNYFYYNMLLLLRLVRCKDGNDSPHEVDTLQVGKDCYNERWIKVEPPTILPIEGVVVWHASKHFFVFNQS